MTDDERLDAMIEAGTTLLGIPLEDAWRPAIRLHLGISLGHAATVLDFPLGDEIDPAPVYRA